MGGAAGNGSGGSAGTVSAGRGGTGSAGASGSAAGLGGKGGSSAVGGGGASAAGAGSGGLGGLGGSASSAGSGGRAGSATGGAPTGGSAGAAGATAGSGGSGGSMNGGSQPSAGCGKGQRPNGGIVNSSNPQRIITFPESYDGSTPFPLLIGLHAAGNPIEHIKGFTDNTDFEDNYVRAFPKSAGNEWIYGTDLEKVLGLYDDIAEEYCIDEGRVFATGHSSGAQMIVQILANANSVMHIPFKAVAPVAASNYGAILRPIPVMYIQGEADSVRRSDGADVVARFTSANSCSMSSMPYSEVSGCSRGGTMVNPGCVVYQDCEEPTVWCSHNDPEYSNTNHGWPCFATRAMYDFFASLP